MPLFETAYQMRLGSYSQEAAHDLLRSFILQVEHDPKGLGVPHPVIDDIWVYESPKLSWLPIVVIAYTIDDELGSVDLYNLYCL